MKIRTKVLLVVLPLLVFPFLLIGVTSFISARTGITKVAKEFLSYKVTEMFKYCRRQEDILTETGLIELEGYQTLAQKSADEYSETIRLSETGYFFAFDSNGDIIFPESDAGNISDYEFYSKMKKSNKGLLTFTYRESERVGYYMYFEPWDWYIVLSEIEDIFYRDANNIKKQVAYTMGITLVFAIGLILFFLTKVTNPLRNMVNTMKEIITSNDLSQRARVEYDDEVGHLATWFNRMVGDLEMAYNQIKQYAYKSVLAKNSEEKIRHIFQKYVPGEIIDEVLKTKGQNLLLGKKQTTTILFSDIRSFTTISEKLSAEELVLSLNTYFNIMVGIIIDHKGIIDKFIGDAIMSIFGAPVLHEDDPLQAVITGLEMLKSLEGFNRKQVKMGRPVFRIGIGLNTGEVVVGNIGSNQKLDYTCIGDAVNLASRLEGLTKMYGVQIIISEFTHAQTASGIKAREIDSVRVKGKIKPVKIFEPYNDVPKKTEEGYRLFSEGISLYRNRSFDEALQCFKHANSVLGGDMPSSLYEDRCNELIQNPPGEEWDGVFTAKTK
ncbi:MAG: Cache 3/Cache 2 fusion domain-containing protein [Spirochaetes bacterium]|nr:Cache 3/Cache 2 fusion domain-containing protein [Spirochaetota bacterium]